MPEQAAKDHVKPACELNQIFHSVIMILFLEFPEDSDNYLFLLYKLLFLLVLLHHVKSNPLGKEFLP